MDVLQTRRLNQLIDKLISRNITSYEYMEYKYLWELISKESNAQQRSTIERTPSNTPPKADHFLKYIHF